jgi:hypothetical protein
MKAMFFVLLCASVILTACKKNGEVLNKLDLNGTWELRATRGGNIIPATYAPGNGHIIIFNNSEFASYAGGVLEEKVSFQRHSDGMGHDTLILANGNLANNLFNEELATMHNDTLMIDPFFPDIATSFYIKTSNSTSFN